MISNYAESDNEAVLLFLSNYMKDYKRAGCFHPGDFIWRTYFANRGLIPENDIAVYLDESSKIAGFAWYSKDGGYTETFVRPDLADSGAYDLLFEWTEKRILDELQDGESIEFVSGGIENDPVKEAFLAKHRYVKINEPWDNDIVFFLSLESEVMKPLKIENFSLITVVPEYYETVLSDRADQFTVSDYQRLAGQAFYKRELDLAYLSPSGELAAYAVCWFDPLSKTAIIEPLYTVEKYRRNKLALSLILEQIQRLKNMGATALYVGTPEGNGDAVNFYEKIGFQRIARDMGWVREFRK